MKPCLVSRVALNAWLPLCRITDLDKNTVYNVEFMDKSVDVVKSNHIEIFDDRCPHRGAKLSRGLLGLGCVECPYHGMKFDVGSGVCTEFLGDYDTSKVKAKLKKHRVKTFDNLAWGYVGEGEPPKFTADTLTDDFDDFVSVYGETDIECNMFEVEENLLDNLHISVVHSWGNPSSLPLSTVKSNRGHYFFYQRGTNSLANWLDNTGNKNMTVFNGFAEPVSTLSRVSFGTAWTKSVRVHLLPLSENRTRMFWGLHRNFMKAWWLDGVFKLLIEKTIDEDKNIIENIYSNPNQILTEFDGLIVDYRKRVRAQLIPSKEQSRDQ